MESTLLSTYRDAIINSTYLLAAVLFIVGLKGLSHPRTAVRGNVLGALGMLIAVVITLLDRHVVRFELIAAGVVAGSLVGAVLSAKIAMTAMPQLVALLNGFGGAASTLVSGAALLEIQVRGGTYDMQTTVSTVLAALIGAVTFWGSLIAFFKLQEIVVPSGAVTSPVVKALTGLTAVVSVVCCVMVALNPPAFPWFWLLCAVSSILGVTLVLPIGGADMPVVIALLNSYSGMAAAGTGFVLNNSVLIVAGSLVGTSGIILTKIMCKAMNRSLTNVVFGGFGAEAGATANADDVYGGKVTSASAEEAAMIFEGASRVVIVPGYGMAVSQAQHAVRDLSNVLQERGVEVTYAIHPVAGRMPGHMNVLLAEADIPYDQLLEMDQVNPMFPNTDVALVIGANDVVNPLARTDPKSPIAGMPILDVDKARTVMVIKRSLSPGFAGIPNPLFAGENTMMLFGDGKKIIVELITALKQT